MSGTPFRSDQVTIPFVSYTGGELAQPDFEYGFRDALTDLVRSFGRSELPTHQGSDGVDGARRPLVHEATFDDRLARELASQRLRTALDVSGEWLPAVLAQAHAQLMHLRRADPTAAGLAIAIDQEHAKGIAACMEERLGVSPTIATSDDPGASEKISRFASGVLPWIVAVRMVSEGVDIPRLRVGVYATNTVTELFFRQAVGRLVRWNARLRRQAAYMFIPDDVRLRVFGAAIAEQRRHSLRKEQKDDDREGEAPAKRTETERDLSEQLSLFAPISAMPLDEEGRPLEGERVYAHNDVDAEASDAQGGEGEGEIPGSRRGRRLTRGLRRAGGPLLAGGRSPSPWLCRKMVAIARRREPPASSTARPCARPRARDGEIPRRAQQRVELQGRDQEHQPRHAPAASKQRLTAAEGLEASLGGRRRKGDGERSEANLGSSTTCRPTGGLKASPALR